MIMSEKKQVGERNFRPIRSSKAGSLRVQQLNQLPYHSLTKHVQWLLMPSDCGSLPDLANELRLFADCVQPDVAEREVRNTVVRSIEKMISEEFPGCGVNVFGSFPAGLSTFLSDLDISVVNTELFKWEETTPNVGGVAGDDRAAEGGVDAEVEAEKVSWVLDRRAVDCAGVLGNCDSGAHRTVGGTGRSPDVQLDALYAVLQVRKFILMAKMTSNRAERTVQRCEWVESLQLRAHARVPIVYLTHRSSLCCDVSVNVAPSATSQVLLRLVERCGPALFTLSAFLKVYLGQLGLDAPFTGGLGSYKLYVLLAKHLLDQYQYQAPGDSVRVRVGSQGQGQEQAQDLGAQLLSFLEHYGSPANLNSGTVVEVAGLEAVSFERTSKVMEVREAFAVARRVLAEALHARAAATGASVTASVTKGHIDGATNGGTLAQVWSTLRSESLLAPLLNTAYLSSQRMQSKVRCRSYLDSLLSSCGAADTASADRSSPAADLEEQLQDLKARLLASRKARLTSDARVGPSPATVDEASDQHGRQSVMIAPVDGFPESDGSTTLCTTGSSSSGTNTRNSSSARLLGGAGDNGCGVPREAAAGATGQSVSAPKLRRTSSSNSGDSVVDPSSNGSIGGHPEEWQDRSPARTSAPKVLGLVGKRAREDTSHLSLSRQPPPLAASIDRKPPTGFSQAGSAGAGKRQRQRGAPGSAPVPGAARTPPGLPGRVPKGRRELELELPCGPPGDGIAPPYSMDSCALHAAVWLPWPTGRPSEDLPMRPPAPPYPKNGLPGLPYAPATHYDFLANDAALYAAQYQHQYQHYLPPPAPGYVPLPVPPPVPPAAEGGHHSWYEHQQPFPHTEPTAFPSGGQYAHEPFCCPWSVGSAPHSAQQQPLPGHEWLQPVNHHQHTVTAPAAYQWGDEAPVFHCLPVVAHPVSWYYAECPLPVYSPGIYANGQAQPQWQDSGHR